MKSVTLAVTLTLLLSGVALAQNRTFTGEVMDSACAQSGGSHDAMTAKNPKLTAKTCTLGCVKGGAKFVLYDSDTKTVYQLDDQKKPEKLAGDKVQVTGTLDAATKTIHVASMKAQAIPSAHSTGW